MRTFRTILMCFMWRCARAIALFLISFAPIASHATPGQPGTLDASFGSGGSVITGFTQQLAGGEIIPAAGQSKSSAILPDGRILLAGTCSDRFCIARYLPNGTLDVTFGSSGRVTNQNLNQASANAIALLKDGKILVTGTCANSATLRDFCTVRYQANGSVDTSFGVGGYVITLMSSVFGGYTNAIAVQPDGKIIVAGSCNNGVHHDFCAMRYLADGSADSTFGVNGRVRETITTSHDVVNSIVVQTDGKIVMAGYCDAGWSSRFCAVRYNDNGTLDLSFDLDGIAQMTAVGLDSANAMVAQPDGKLVLAGSCNYFGDQRFCARRLNSDGSPDLSFGSNGVTSTLIGIFGGTVSGMIRQSDGKLVLAGSCGNGVGYDFCALRYNADGTLDTSFGSRGWISARISGLSFANSVAIQSDGKFILAGSCWDENNYAIQDFCAARYDGGTLGAISCSPDIDGDSLYTASTDGVMISRAMMGFSASSITQGVTFPSNALRKDTASVSAFLSAQCGVGATPPPTPACSLDVDGDGAYSATIDGLIATRVMQGMRDTSVTNGIAFPNSATRKTWGDIQTYLSTQCGMSIPQ